MRAIVGAIDPILLLAFAAYGAGLVPVAPMAALCGALSALVTLRATRGCDARLAALLAVVVAGSGVRAQLALEEGHARRARAIAATSPPARCELEGELVSSPQHRAGTPRALVRVRSGRCGERALAADEVVMLHGLPVDAARGDRLAVTADLAPVQRFANQGTGDRVVSAARGGASVSGRVQTAETLERGGGLAHGIDEARRHVRARIEATYHPEAAPLARALVLGETDLDPEVDEAFRVTGLSHLLAVSGTHLVVAVLTLLGVMRELLVRVPLVAGRWDVERIVAALAIPLALAYADFAGGSGSVLRAALMLCAAMVARALGRRPNAARSVGFALLAGVAVDPLAALDVSFALSLFATLGLLALARPLGALLWAEAPEGAAWWRRAWAGLATALSTTLAATLACAPVVATLSPTLPVLGLVVNVVAAPIGELFALPASLAHAALSPIPSLERGTAMLTSGALRGVLLTARLAASTGLALPVVPPSAWQLAALPTIVVALRAGDARARLARAGLALGVLAALELGARRAGRPEGVLRVSVLDVGQGDAILVDLPDGSLMMIDGGGMPGSGVDLGARVLSPVLRARRRSRVDVAVISHPHPDHYEGLVSTLSSFEVGELWEPGAEALGPVPAGMRTILSGLRARGVPLRSARDLCGAPRALGGATVEVLAPCPELDPDTSANDGSLVIRITHGAHAVLLVGDAEAEAEARLLESARGRLGATLLKVGHHGSRTSSSAALLEAVAPRWAAVSCGIRNRFGHPHPRTLAALEQQGALVLRTDLEGELRWVADGRDAWVE